MRLWSLPIAIVLLVPSHAAAEWQIKPSLGVTFGGDTTFVDPDHAVGSPSLVFGISGMLLGKVVGVEADLTHGPGFFQSGDQHLVVESSATTLTGNFVVAVPRHLAAYTLRPYFVGGGGLMHAHIVPSFGALQVDTTLPAIDFGAGVTGFLSDRIGLCWELRSFRSIRGKTEFLGTNFAAEQLSFWRASMALAIRY